MSKPNRVCLWLAAVAGMAMATTVANAALVTEYFNNYGTTAPTDMTSAALNGGSGWSTAWAGNTSAPIYEPGTQLTYTATGYSASDNESGSNDGAIKGGASDVSFASRQVSSMDGTVWLSMLVSGLKSSATVGFSSSGANNTWLRAEAAQLRWRQPSGTITNYAIGSTLSESGTHLLLGRIVFNATGNETVHWWIDPTLNTNGTAPSDASAVVARTVDQLGIGLTRINLTGTSTSTTNAPARFDAIRISNDANGFQQVTQVIPEPTGLMALSAGAMCLLPRRRTSRGEQR